MLSSETLLHYCPLVVLFSADFKKEDIARTLLYTMCQELVGTVMYSMHVTRVRHMFLGGGFVAHPLTRSLVMEEFEFRKWVRAANGGDVVSTHEYFFLLKISLKFFTGKLLKHLRFSRQENAADLQHFYRSI